MYRSVSMDEFGQKQRREDISIIDVREVEEFSDGHIPGAVNMPLSGLVEGHESLEKNKEYHVICRSGGRSSMACDFLGNEGYDVVNVMGGMSAWKEEIE